MCPTKSFLSSSKGLWAVFPLLGKLPKPKTSTRPYYCYGLKAKFNVGLLTVEMTIHKEISAVPIYSGFHLDTIRQMMKVWVSWAEQNAPAGTDYAFNFE